MSLGSGMKKQTQQTSPLISAEELIDLQKTDANGIVIFDCSMHLPTSDRNAKREFEQSRIPSSVYFDIDAISDPDSDLPHMVPSASLFEVAVSELGVNANSRVIVYDSLGLFSAARAWWMFRIFGHENVQLLDGGLPAWIDAGGKTVSDSSAVEQPKKSNVAVDPDQRFKAVFDPARVASKADVQKATTQDDVVILDARARARFNGEVAEPRAGLASGHIPSSSCLPFTELLDDGRFRSPSEIEQQLKSIGLSAEDIATGGQTVITSCGSGVTAAVITLALEMSGYGLQRLYDGSWTEWGQQG